MKYTPNSANVEDAYISQKTLSFASPCSGLTDAWSAVADLSGPPSAAAAPVPATCCPVHQPDLNVVLSRANVGILHRDLQQRVLVVNERFCELVGRSAEELAGLSLEAFTYPDDFARSAAIFAAHLARAEPFEIEKRYLRPDGSTVWCAIHVSFVTDEAGQATSTITIAKDITLRQQALSELRESEEHYRYAVELNPQITWTADADGQISEASRRWCDVTGIEPQDALGYGWTRAMHPDDIPATLAIWQGSIDQRVPVDTQYRLKTVDGSFRWFRARAAPRLDNAGLVLRWYGTLEDIHDRLLAEQAMRDSEERFRLAAHAAGLGIWDYDVLEDRREWSSELKSLFGFDADTVPSVPMAFGCVVPEDRGLVEPMFAAVHAGDTDVSFKTTFRIRRADDGAERWLSTGGWQTFTDNGRLSRVLITVRDVTEERTADARIRWTALHDALTQLPNRSHFNQMLDSAIENARADGRGLALLLLDIDRLKEANDLIGHDAGDLLLQTFAARARDIVGSRGTVARVGGDEFAVLMPDADEAIMQDVTSRLMHNLRQPFTVRGYTLDCQATAGASLYPHHAETAAEMLRAADIALYVGKAEQRGNVAIFHAEMQAAMQRRSSMLRETRSIIRDQLVIPFYQPKVSLTDGRVTGFEALLRWKHAERGIQGPETILGAFEDIDLATDLSELMLDAIIGDMRRWLDQGHDFGRIAFNISPAEFRCEKMADRILQRLSDAGIAPSLFEIEVTETVFLGAAAEKVSTQLRKFHEAGVTIALDDFGTGYASLTHLKAFPVDVIKIDRSFISNLTAASGDAAIVNAVIGLGRDLGIEVVAEGVETEAQAQHLRAQGCRSAQGYLFGRPQNADMAIAQLSGPPPAE